MQRDGCEGRVEKGSLGEGREVRLEGRVRQLRDKGRGWDGRRVY